MPNTLTLLHTAQVHCETFDALGKRIAPDLVLDHHVHAAWLAQAQDGISPELEREISTAVLAAEGTVICTCTTIGPVAAGAGAIRIDMPMMQAAAATDGPILLAYCLDSTRAPSLDLLHEALEAAGNTAAVHPLALPHLWPLFEAERIMEFHVAIARAVCESVEDMADPGCVVLAQVSMAGAAPFLADLPCPVLASPELALRAGLARM